MSHCHADLDLLLRGALGLALGWWVSGVGKDDGTRPSEDCGGVSGHECLLEILTYPQDEGCEYIVDWLGGEFERNAMDLAAVTEELGCLR